MSPKEYADHRGVVERTVRAAIARGAVRLWDDGTVDVAWSDANWLPAQRRPRHATMGVDAPISPGAEAKFPDVADSRAMLEAYKAKMQQLEYRTRRKRVVDTERARLTFFAWSRRVRDRLLALPGRMQGTLAAECVCRACGSPVEVREVGAKMRAELARLLEELADPELHPVDEALEVE